MANQTYNKMKRQIKEIKKAFMELEIENKTKPGELQELFNKEHCLNKIKHIVEYED